MLDSVRRHVAVPRISSKAVLAAGAAASFVWLLVHDLIHPIVIYALELYLIF